MAQQNEIMPFSEYLRQLERQFSEPEVTESASAQGVDEFVAVDVPVETDMQTFEQEATPSADVIAQNEGDVVAEAETQSVQAVSEETVAVDTGNEELLAADFQSDDLDALFQELLKASATNQTTQWSNNKQSSPAESASEDPRIAQMEQQMQQMQQMLQQTLQAVQQTAQIVNLQQETEAFRMVARSLQADGIFLTEQQLRDLWNEAYMKGFPPSLVVKAHAFDMLQRERPNLQAYRQQPPQFPFLTPPPTPREERPNQFRSYREFLQEMQYQQQYQQQPTTNYYNEP